RPHRLVRVRPGRVRPHQRDQRRGEQRERPARLGVQEAANRGREVPRPGRAPAARDRRHSGILARAMETGNTAMALGFAKAITNRDREAALAVCHPDIEFRSMLGIDGRSYRGHDGIREYFDDIDSAFSEWSIEVEQVVEGDDGRVAIVMTMHARGQGSGAELAGRTGHVW